MGLEKMIFKVFPMISLYGSLRPLGCGQFEPKGHVWQQLDIARTKNISCGPHDFRDEDF